MDFKKMRKIIFVFIISVFILTGCSSEDFGFKYTVEHSNGTGLTITKEKYDSLNYGADYSEVVTLLGGKCKNYYSSDNEDWYTCIDDEDSEKRIVLKFVEKKLEHKSSSGLN